MKRILFLLSFSFFISTGFAQVYKDVAPIFHSRCTGCHNQYSTGPSFLNYSSIFVWKAGINVDLTSGKMPPWKPDTTYTRFLHERIITPTEKATILNWIANGAPAGDTTQAPLPPTYSKYWIKPQPDMVLTIPTFTSNAFTGDSYVCFSLPTNLTQDRILRAYEVVAGDPKIVHHVVVNVDTTGTTTSNLAGNCYNITGHFSIGGFAPGSPPTIFPADSQLKMGIRLKAGSKLVLQIHYPIGSANKVDSTSIRLYFYPQGTTGVRHVYCTTPLQNWTMNLPPNTVKTYTAQYPSSGGLTGAMSMYAIFPHSHKIATSILNYAYMGTDTVKLSNIPKWDFEWQGYYTFTHLKKINAGYKLYAKHVFDNTTNNPFNPTPVQVNAGPDTKDEMLFDGIQYINYQSGDELIDMGALFANDPLFASVQETKLGITNAFTSYAYPNPFENSVKIAYMLKEASNVNIEIYSVFGQHVRTLYNGFDNEGLHEIEWNAKSGAGANLASGTYFYIIKAGNKQSYGKLSLVPGKN